MFASVQKPALLALLSLATACGDKGGDPDPTQGTDDTGGLPEDCQPGAEVCDGVDNDCDGVVDNGVESVYFRDADGDGYGDPTQTTSACEAPPGFVPNEADCDDTDDGVHPDAPERCATEGVDDDCDGQVDEPDAEDAGYWYADADGDGFGDPATATPSCTPMPDLVTDATDCADDNALVYPGAPELCDGRPTDCLDATWDSDAGLAHFLPAGSDTWQDVAADLGGAGATALTELTLDTVGTLQICEGQWAVSLTTTADVDIVGVGGPEVVVLTGLAEAPVLTVAAEGTAVTLSHLTIADGLATHTLPVYPAWYRLGGGLACLVDADVHVLDVVFEGNDSPEIGAVLGSYTCDVLLEQVVVQSDLGTTFSDLFTVYDSALELRDSTFEDVEVGDRVGRIHGDATLSIASTDFTRVETISGLFFADVAFHTDTCASLSAEGVTVTGSDTGSYGFFGADEACELSVVDSTFTDNEGHDAVVGSHFGEEGHFLISGTTVTGSLADYNGVALFEDAAATIQDCTFEGNEGGDSGALNLYGGLVTVTDTIFTDNVGSNGADLSIWTGAEVVVDGASFTGGRASSRGGSIYLAGSPTLSLIDSTFEDCEAGTAGDGIYLGSGSAEGTGVAFTDVDDEVYVAPQGQAYDVDTDFSCDTSGCE